MSHIMTDEAGHTEDVADQAQEDLESIRRQDLQNIRAFARAGRPLTAEQLRRLEAADRGQGALNLEMPATGQPVYVANQSMLAEALNLADRKTIQRWLRKEGAPQATDDGRYDVTAWRAWMLGNGLGSRRKEHDLESLKKEHATLDLRTKQIELDELEGRSAPIDDVVRIVVEQYARMVQGFRSMRHSLAPAVVGETVPEASKRIAAAVDEVLGQFAIPESAKKKVFWRNASTKLASRLPVLLHTIMPEPTSVCTTETDGTLT
jgi:hypothetical protein